MRVAILDYGMCNLLNVARAFEAIEAEVKLIDSAGEAGAADRLVIPGVGAFRDSIDEVRSRGYHDVIRRFIETGRPFLGVCVGMQMLFDASEEFGEHEGLGILPGRVQAVPSTTTAGAPQRVPHIGWNVLRPSNDRDWTGTLMAGSVGQDREVYFVHSFAAVPGRAEDRLADCYYGGHALCAAVQRDNIMGTQFHPERSGAGGLDMLRRFIAM